VTAFKAFYYSELDDEQKKQWKAWQRAYWVDEEIDFESYTEEEWESKFTTFGKIVQELRLDLEQKKLSAGFEHTGVKMEINALRSLYGAKGITFDSSNALVVAHARSKSRQRKPKGQRAAKKITRTT
jgi:hypothetical protein